MNSTVVSILKASVAAFYVLAALSPFISALAPHSTILLAIAALLLVSHVFEYFGVRKRLADAEPGPMGHFIGTLLFGFVYWLPLIKRPNA